MSSSRSFSRLDEHTETSVALPWLPRTSVRELSASHLVVLWFYDDPDRVGQVARIDEESWLGRHSLHETTPPMQFYRQRPAQASATHDLTSNRISRRQLSFVELDDERIRVDNVGKRTLRVNGQPVKSAIVAAGDTLLLEHTALFLIERRPLLLPRSQHYAPGGFAFGAPDPHGLVGESPLAWRLRDQLAAAAAADAHLLLFGETGAGKEVAARVVHELSLRNRGPLIARNAATMPSTLLDAELFGNAKNYPNTTSPERVGLVGAAHNGHLLLDEIGELPEAHQAHLLRVLDGGGEYHRLGESKARVSNFRLIAATNREPTRLKHDFLARFQHRVEVAGLNERRSDIPLLVRELVRRLRSEIPHVLEPFLEPERPTEARMDPDLVDALVRHRYTQHTRELQRLLQLSIATSSDGYLALTEEVMAELCEQPPGAEIGTFERAQPPAGDVVASALAAAGGNVTQAAESLGLSRHALRRLMKRYRLSRGELGR